jgi:hypothetical protein
LASYALNKIFLKNIEGSCACRAFLENPERKRGLGRTRHSSVIKVYLKEIAHKGVDWIHLLWQGLVAGSCKMSG